MYKSTKKHVSMEKSKTSCEWYTIPPFIYEHCNEIIKGTYPWYRMRTPKKKKIDIICKQGRKKRIINTRHNNIPRVVRVGDRGCSASTT